MNNYQSILASQYDFNPLMDLINLQSSDVSKFTIVAPSKISAWAEQSGTAWNQTTDANRPLLTDGVVFDGSNDTLLLGADITAANYSFYCVVRYLGTNTGTTGNRALFAANTAADWLGFGNNFTFQVNTSSSAKRTALSGYKGNRHIVLGIRKNGNTFTFTVNDRVLLQSGATAVTNTLFGRLGTISGFSGFTPNMSLKALCVSSQVLSDSVHQQVVNSLYSKYVLNSNITPDNVCGFGDSNTFGQGVSSYLIALSSSLSLAYLNLGISGTLFTNVTAQTNNGYSRYQAQIVTKPYTDYIVVQYGTNDILNGTVTANTYETQMDAMITNLIAQGYSASKICLCSVPYQVSNQNSAMLDAYRTKLVTISTNRGTKYFDLLQDMRDNGGDSLLTDAVHLNATAQTRWANGVYIALTTP